MGKKKPNWGIQTTKTPVTQNNARDLGESF